MLFLHQDRSCIVGLAFSLLYHSLCFTFTSCRCSHMHLYSLMAYLPACRTKLLYNIQFSSALGRVCTQRRWNISCVCCSNISACEGCDLLRFIWANFAVMGFRESDRGVEFVAKAVCEVTVEEMRLLFSTWEHLLMSLHSSCSQTSIDAFFSPFLLNHERITSRYMHLNFTNSEVDFRKWLRLLKLKIFCQSRSMSTTKVHWKIAIVQTTNICTDRKAEIA